MPARGRAALVATVVALAAAPAPAFSYSERPLPETVNFYPHLSVSVSSGQAGSPARLELAVAMPPDNQDPIESMSFNLPPGFAADRNATRLCRFEELDQYEGRLREWRIAGGDPGTRPPFPCGDAVVGGIAIDNVLQGGSDLAQGYGSGLVINMAPRGPHQGSLMVYIDSIVYGSQLMKAMPIRVPVDVVVRDEADFSLDNFAPSMPWGFALNPISRPDNKHLLRITKMRLSLDGTLGARPSQPGSSHPLLRLPTACGRHRIEGAATSYGDALGVKRTRALSATVKVRGCRKLAFSPSFHVDLSRKIPGATAALEGVISFPASGMGQADAKSMEISFPPGTALNITGLAGKVFCKRGEAESANCPEQARIGTIEASSNLLPAGDGPLKGGIYLVEPDPQRGRIGLLLKLSGFVNLVRLGELSDLSASPITTSFDDIPQMPIERLRFSIEDGLVKLPKACGAHSFTLRALSWSRLRHSDTSTVELPCITPASKPKLSLNLSRKRGLKATVSGSAIKRVVLKLKPLLRGSAYKSSRARERWPRLLKSVAPSSRERFKLGAGGKLTVDAREGVSRVSFTIPTQLLRERSGQSCRKLKVRGKVVAGAGSQALSASLKPLCASRAGRASAAGFDSGLARSIKGYFGQPALYAAGSAPTSLALADLSNDGLDDVVSNGGGVTVLANVSGIEGGPALAGAATPSGRQLLSIDAEDLDGDGHQDLYGTPPSFRNQVELFKNSAQKGSLALSYEGTAQVNEPGDCSGWNVFKETSLVAGDITGDELPEIVATAPGCERIYPLWNRSDRCRGDVHSCSQSMGFERFPIDRSEPYKYEKSFYNRLSLKAARTSALADLDGDGMGELIVAADSGDLVPGGGVQGAVLRIFKNITAKVGAIYANNYNEQDPDQLQEMPIQLRKPVSTQSVVGVRNLKSADLDGDGGEDLVGLRPAAGELLIFRNVYNPELQPRRYLDSPLSYQLAPNTAGIELADLDSDGLEDIVTSAASGKVSVLMNESHSQLDGGAGIIFSKMWEYDLGSEAGDIAAGDLDRDGDGELIVALPAQGAVALFEGLFYGATSWPPFPSPPPSSPAAGKPKLKASLTRRGSLKVTVTAGRGGPNLEGAKLAIRGRKKGARRSRQSSVKVRITSALAAGARKLKKTVRRRQLARLDICRPLKVKAFVDLVGSPPLRLSAKTAPPRRICRGRGKNS